MRLRYALYLRRIFKLFLFVAIILGILYLAGIPVLVRQLTAEPGSLSLFTHSVKSFCKGDFQAYVHKFAYLRNVIVEPSKAEGRPGGEDVLTVLNQPEYVEYFDFTPGFFTMSCSAAPTYRFRDDHHLNLWMDVIEPYAEDLTPEILLSKGRDHSHQRVTIAVTRYEYANLYHQLADFYNAFIMIKVFNLDPEETDILLVDGHPHTTLDEIWEKLFGNVLRLGQMKGPVLFSDMVWNIQGYTSSIHQHSREKIPEIPAFSDFVLDRFGVTSTKKPDCMDISILFIWRRNYIAHPRNPSGLVARKILNEDEVLTYVRGHLKIGDKPSGTVTGVHLESLPFKEQLKLIRETDILVGMHGAGLSHGMFLPSHAGLLEIYSTSTLAVNQHFESIARWRGLKYKKYQLSYSAMGVDNDDCVLEPEEIAELIDELKNEICKDL